MLKTEIGRLVAYAAGMLAGVAAVVIGALRSDMELVAVGAALIGTNGLAGANVHRAPIVEQVPVTGTSTYADTDSMHVSNPPTGEIPKQRGRHAAE